MGLTSLAWPARIFPCLLFHERKFMSGGGKVAV